METSSPLAAMHRPAAPFGKRDLFTNLRVRLSPGKPRSSGRGLSGLNGLNGSGTGGVFSIRDQLNQECFGPVHGSSPAGSLAADLCQNFSIGEDASPRFPTPRRALFTTTCHSLKAPPLPVSSSPLPVEALMDMTPIPKKVVAAYVADSEIQMSMFSPASPCPTNETNDQMMLESPCPPQPAAAPAPAPAPLAATAPIALEPSRTLASALEYVGFHPLAAIYQLTSLTQL